MSASSGAPASLRRTCTFELLRATFLSKILHGDWGTVARQICGMCWTGVLVREIGMAVAVECFVQYHGVDRCTVAEPLR